MSSPASCSRIIVALISCLVLPGQTAVTGIRDDRDVMMTTEVSISTMTTMAADTMPTMITMVEEEQQQEEEEEATIGFSPLATSTVTMTDTELPGFSTLEPTLVEGEEEEGGEEDDDVDEATTMETMTTTMMDTTMKDELERREARDGDSQRPKPVFDKVPGFLQFFNVNEPFVLSCSAVSVDGGPVNYSWLKNGQLVDLSSDAAAGRALGWANRHNGHLMFSAPRQFDAGSYECVAENANGRVVSKPVLVMANTGKDQLRPRSFQHLISPSSAI